MKIQLAEHYGLCFGVRDAIAEAERLAQQGPLTVLGELAHNPIVRNRLAALGVREGRLDAPTAAATRQVMITAHGASDTAREAWKKAGFDVADGTCPLVRHAHAQLRLLVSLGYFPVVIGKRGHVEVAGLIGDFPNAYVIESAGDIAALPASDKCSNWVSDTNDAMPSGINGVLLSDTCFSFDMPARCARPGPVT